MREAVCLASRTLVWNGLEECHKALKPPLFDELLDIILKITEGYGKLYFDLNVYETGRPLLWRSDMNAQSMRVNAIFLELLIISTL